MVWRGDGCHRAKISRVSDTRGEIEALANLTSMGTDPPDPGEAILAMALELRDVAEALGATYLTAHVPAAGDETVVLTVQGGVVTMTAHGFEQRLLESRERSS
jgi:hypothetical protein